MHSAACSNNCLLVVEYFIIINTIIIAGSMWKRREISSSGTCWRQTRASTSASLTIWPPLENHPPSHYPSTVSCLLLPSFSPLLSSSLLRLGYESVTHLILIAHSPKTAAIAVHYAPILLRCHLVPSSYSPSSSHRP